VIGLYVRAYGREHDDDGMRVLHIFLQMTLFFVSSGVWYGSFGVNSGDMKPMNTIALLSVSPAMPARMPARMPACLQTIAPSLSVLTFTSEKEHNKR
jgi:hypothetical protein